MHYINYIITYIDELRWTLDEYIKYGKENAINKKWMTELENASIKYHVSRLEALELQLRQQAEVLHHQQEQLLSAGMKSLYKDGYYHTAYELQKGMCIGTAMNALDDKILNIIIHRPWHNDGRDFSKRIWSNRDNLVQSLHTELTHMTITGEPPDKAIGRIAKHFDVSKSRATTLVQTEHAAMAEKARADCFKDLGVERYIYIATLDSYTSEICQDLDGEHFAEADREIGINSPPMHPRCRSTTAPYFDDMATERFARDIATGKGYTIPWGISYKHWKNEFIDSGSKSELKNVEIPLTKEQLKPVVPDGKVESKKEDAEPSKTRQSLELANVEYREVQPLEKELFVQEIIDRVGGGDMTKDSCSSLAFAYAGNRNGLNVLDFRGGKSQSIFSRKGNIKEITELAGGKIVSNFNDYKAVNELLKSVVECKEYYLATGKHAAIVRMIERHYEYLELQSATDNGWFRLTNDVLKRRFECQKSHSVHGFKLEATSVLIDIESLNRLDEFEILLGYINTAVESQMKGSDGHVK